MRIWVVLPAYNEAENIGAIFEGLKVLAEDAFKLDFSVILVDDGSKDDTAAIAKRGLPGLRIEVLMNETNQGLAATFKRGIMAAAERAEPRDIIVCMDADNSHIPGQILRMIRNIQEGRDVIIASRYRSGAVVKGVAFHRQMLSLGMSFLFRIVYPIPGVRDYSCGYRAYRASFLQKALSSGRDLFTMEGFACMVNILLRLHKEGAICGEVPIVLRYDQKQGASKMQVGGTVVRTLRVLLRERFSKD